MTACSDALKLLAMAPDPGRARKLTRAQFRWGQPDSSNRQFSDIQPVFDYLQEAMAAVLLTYTAIDNAANKAMPANFRWGRKRRYCWPLTYLKGTGVSPNVSR